MKKSKKGQKEMQKEECRMQKGQSEGSEVRSQRSEVSESPAPADRLSSDRCVIDITSFDQFEQLNDLPVTCEFPLFGKNVRLTGRRLRPSESNRVRLLLDRALPPEMPVKEGEVPRYDVRNPAYWEEKEKWRRQARAFTLARAFPFFAEMFEAAGVPLNDPEKLAGVLEEKRIEDDVLDVLFTRVTARATGVDADLINFFSGSSSQTG